MIDFIERHHDLIFDILPEFMHTKTVMTLIHVIFFIFLIKITNFAIEKFLDKMCQFKDDFEVRKQLFTLKSITKSVADTLIVAFAIMFILNNLGIDIRPILTAAGVLGVAVGFGAKRFFEDIITGFSLLLEGQIRVGDYVDISGHQGVVEKIDIKLIQIRDMKGVVHYIRNGMVDVVENYTRNYSYYLMDIGVDYSSDVDFVIKTLFDLDVEFRQKSENKDDILAPIEIFGLDRFDDSAIIIRARLKTKPMKQWAVGREFNKCMKKRFDELGIEFPFPQRTLHVVNDSSTQENL